MISLFLSNYAFLYITSKKLKNFIGKGWSIPLLSIPGRQDIVEFKNRNKLNSWKPKFKTPNEIPTLLPLKLKKMS